MEKSKIKAYEVAHLAIILYSLAHGNQPTVDTPKTYFARAFQLLEQAEAFLAKMEAERDYGKTKT